MWTGRTPSVLPDLELDDRAFLQAVVDVALALDAMGLPVVGAGRVEPELREVEELRLVLEDAALLLGLADRLLGADHAVAVLLLGLADVDPDLALALDAHLEGRRRAGRNGGAALGRERRDAAGGERRGGACQHQRGDEHTGKGAKGHRATLTAMIAAVGKVFVTRTFPFDALERLRAEHEVDVWDDNAPPPREVLLERAAQADALLTIITEKVDAELFDAAPSVRAVANLAVGTDNIDLEEAARRGIPVGNTPGVLTDATADIAFALLLGIARRINEGERQVRDGEWVPWYPTHMVGGDTTGMTLGIVGWGRIGQAMARRGEGFGMRIIHSSRSSGIPLEELLEQADYVSLHTPLTDATRHLMGEAEFARMKRTAYLINTARGGTVDQAALTRALHEGQIAGAGLDGTDPEP